MLHENPCMADIDVNHWRNLQELLLDSAKEKRRIILIHEDGELLKFVHSNRADIIRNITRITHPAQDAEKVFHANAARTDFVVVLERRAVERFFAQVQDSWKADEDLDVYVHRMFATLDEFPEGIVTYPGPARQRLGLQWRVGASHEAVKAAVDRFVPPETTAIFGVFQNDTLWASLVLGFDSARRVSLITTADPSELSLGAGWKSDAKNLVQWVNGKHPQCSMGLFTDLVSAREILATRHKLPKLRALIREGKLLLDPVPSPLVDALSAT